MSLTPPTKRTLIATTFFSLLFVLPLSVVRAQVTYDFQGDTVGQTPAGTSVGAGTFDVQVDDLMGKSVRAVTQVGVIAAINFTNFASSSDYSVTWRQAYSNNMGRGGFTLRSQAADTGVANSTGAKQGYLFHVYDSNAVYIWRVGSASYTALWSGSLTKAEPRWFKAVVIGNNLGFYYSDNGTSYTLIASTTDSTYTSGTVQYTAGYGSFVDRDYIDDVVITPMDGVAPLVSAFDPADNAVDVNVNANFKITFNENSATTSTGNIYLKKTADNSIIETIGAISTKITASSTNAFVINPATTLGYSTEYYFQIDSGVFRDGSGNNFAGISATTTWSFTTESAPPDPEPTPDPEPETTPTVASAPKPGTSTARRIANLISMGKIQEAEYLRTQLNMGANTNTSTASAPKNVAGVAGVPSTTAPTNTRDLELGMTSDDVITLQKFLNSKGFSVAQSGPGSAGNETSYFGTMTRDALAKYQSDSGISPARGYFGPITRNKIKSE